MISAALEIAPHSDIFDPVIVATAKVRHLPLITKDTVITESESVEIFW